MPLLKEICETPGVPGYEHLVRKLVSREVSAFSDTLTTDPMGNLIAYRKGKDSSKRVMIAAHMDEIGFIINHIDDKGFLKFIPLGGFDPKTLTNQRVIVHGKEDIIGVMGSKPIHVMSPDERNKPVKIDDFFIDLGMEVEQVKELVFVGAPVTRERQLIEMGNCVNCKSIDNRVSVFVLIETLRRINTPAFDMFGVFTVQEEVGIRGAMVAAHHIEPHFGIGLDTTIAYDVPGAKPEEMVTKLGDGVAIKIMDASSIADYRMVAFMKEVAGKHNLKWQPELLPAGGTDTAGIQRMSPKGAISGAISIPTRHIHQVIETAHKDDIRLSIELLTACLEEMDTFNWIEI